MSHRSVTVTYMQEGFQGLGTVGFDLNQASLESRWCEGTLTCRRPVLGSGVPCERQLLEFLFPGWSGGSELEAGIASWGRKIKDITKHDTER